MKKYDYKKSLTKKGGAMNRIKRRVHELKTEKEKERKDMEDYLGVPRSSHDKWGLTEKGRRFIESCKSKK